MQNTSKNNFTNTFDTKLRRLLRKFGRNTLVIFITLISISISIILTIIATLNIDGVTLKQSLPIAITVPSLVAPFISWAIIGLLIKLEDMEREMRQLATYDALTTLLTRQAFYHDAQNWLNLTKREQHNIAVIMIDIDNFKHINDTYGHHTGDKVLNKIGLFLKECTREIDIAGRLGGEEFAILFWNISEKDSITRTEAIRLAIEKLQIHVNEIKIPVTISIGISFCTKDTSCNLHHILKKADIALYRAKNTGRNRVILYDKSMKTL